MRKKRPQVVVFYGGLPGNHDLSQATGRWVCYYLPRSRYDVTPVEVTTDGKWKVPLGSLPRSGPVKRTMDMLSRAVRSLVPSRALERLLARPVDVLMTVVRGRGGDDGSVHSLGQSLAIPVVGSPHSTCQQTWNKHVFAQVVGEVANTPYTRRFRHGIPIEEVVAVARDQFMPPLFVKPATQEGSVGVEYVDNVDQLAAAVRRSGQEGDVLLQERRPGTEVAVTLVEDDQGKIHALPPTIIVPQKAAFYDQLAKRRPGRVALHTPATFDNPVMAEAQVIAREVYDELGCRGMVTVDMIAGDGLVDVLEVNTVPVIAEQMPLKHQLKAAGLHPATALDHLIGRSLEEGP